MTAGGIRDGCVGTGTLRAVSRSDCSKKRHRQPPGDVRRCQADNDCTVGPTPGWHARRYRNAATVRRQPPPRPVHRRSHRAVKTRAGWACCQTSACTRLSMGESISPAARTLSGVLLILGANTPSNTLSGRVRRVEAGVTPRAASAQADERSLQVAAHLRQGRRRQAFLVRGDVNAFAADAGRRRRR